MTDLRILPVVTLRHVRINRQGYDDCGGYWGVGQRLYWYAFDEGTGEVSDHIRADDREHAKEIIVKRNGPLKFYR